MKFEGKEAQSIRSVVAVTIQSVFLSKNTLK
jgi:hypothetical protein